MGICVRISDDSWNGCSYCHRTAIIYEGPAENYNEKDYDDGLCLRCRNLNRKPSQGTWMDLTWPIGLIVFIVWFMVM